MVRAISDRRRLPADMNARLDQILAPDEPVLVAMSAISGAVAATDRRAFLWKRATLRTYRYEDLWGVEYSTGLVHWVIFHGPGLDATKPALGNIATHPDAVQLAHSWSEERAALQSLVAAKARPMADAPTTHGARWSASAAVFTTGSSTVQPVDRGLSDGAERALATVLEPTEEVRAWIGGQHGSAIFVTNSRVHVYHNEGRLGKVSIASWPVRSVKAISLERGLFGLLVVHLMGDPSKPKSHSPNAIEFLKSMVAPSKADEERVDVLRRAVADGQQDSVARGDEVDTGPLGEALGRLTQFWMAPTITRVYEGTDAGRHLLEAETHILSIHGYSAASQSEEGGHIHATRIVLTGGLSMLAGSRGTRAKGSITVTFVKAAASTVAPAAPDPMEQLRKLGQLRDAGVLTDAEFEAKKTELLARL